MIIDCGLILAYCCIENVYLHCAPICILLQCTPVYSFSAHMHICMIFHCVLAMFGSPPSVFLYLQASHTWLYRKAFCDFYHSSLKTYLQYCILEIYIVCMAWLPILTFLHKQFSNNTGSIFAPIIWLVTHFSIESSLCAPMPYTNIIHLILHISVSSKSWITSLLQNRF